MLQVADKTELKKLPMAEKIALIEVMLELIREDLALNNAREETRRRRAARRQSLAVAAQALVDDYTSNPELTAFTALDGEDFYENEDLYEEG